MLFAATYFLSLHITTVATGGFIYSLQMIPKGHPGAVAIEHPAVDRSSLTKPFFHDSSSPRNRSPTDSCFWDVLARANLDL